MDVSDSDKSPPLLSSTVFGDNYLKLQEIKKKYDPNNMFSKWFAITPAA